MHKEFEDASRHIQVYKALAPGLVKRKVDEALKSIGSHFFVLNEVAEQS